MSLNVLLVEPDAGLADEIRRALDPVGFTVTALSSGEPAVERCRRVAPDLILLAAELPDMSGFSVCNRLKRAHASVPLILYTAEATDSAIEAHRATRTRADDYLRRPFEMAELLARAASLLNVETPPPARPPPPSPDEAGPPMLQRVAPAAGGAAPPALQRAARLRGSTQPVFPSAPEAPVLAPPVAATPPAPADASSPVASPESSPSVTAAGFPSPMAAPGYSSPPPMTAPAFPPQVAGGPPSLTPIGRLRVKPLRDPGEVFSEQPRDPQPPMGGTPDERLEYFRDRLRARDTFIARVREAVNELKATVSDVTAERDALRSDQILEKARADDLERRLGEAAQDQAAMAARLDDLRRQLHESEDNRQAGSEVLTQTLQRAEATERDLSDRLSIAETERTRLDAQLREDAEAHVRALAAIEAAQAEERSTFDAERTEMDGQRSRDRSEAAARLVRLEERAGGLARERDQVAAVARKLHAEMAARDKREAEARRAAEASDEALRGEVAEARARLDALTGELAEVAARAAGLEKEAGSERERAQRLEGDLGRLNGLEGAAEEAAKLREEVARLRRDALGLRELAKQRTLAAESAIQAAKTAQARSKAADERLAAERARLEGELARLDTELTSARSRADAAEAERNEALAALERKGKDEERLRSLGNAELEKRHASELARLRAALSESERRLEAGVRAEHKLRARVIDLEKAPRPAPPQAEGPEASELKARLKKLGGELADLREENEFLNGEVARFQQKSRDLAKQVESLKES
jgi:CheY-like chemotaxis protein